MTIHAAKGLEFDCVAVADLGRPHLAPRRHRHAPRLRAAGGAVSRRASRPSPQRRGSACASPAPAPARSPSRATGAITDAAAEAEAEERGRLVYVAASRARRG